MMAKAIAAKDAAIAQGASRSESLEERIERLAAKHESERRRWRPRTEDWSRTFGERRSERLLIQGALEIARESRLGLQKQLDSLKRSMRIGATSLRPMVRATRAGADNVHPFAPPRLIG